MLQIHLQNILHITDLCWRGGLIVSALVSESSSLGWSRGWDVVLCSWEGHFTLSASLHPGVQMGTSKMLELHVTLQWTTTIPSKGV